MVNIVKSFLLVKVEHGKGSIVKIGVVYDVFDQKNIVNRATWDAIGLVVMNNTFSVLLQPVCQQLSKYFIVRVEKRDRTPVSDIREISLFGNKGDDGSLEGVR